MKKINSKLLSNAEYAILSDLDVDGGWTVTNSYGESFDFSVDDLMIAENGAIMKPSAFSFSQRLTRDSDSHEFIGESGFEWTEYNLLITKEDFKRLLGEAIQEDAEWLLKNLSRMVNRVADENTIKEFIIDVQVYAKY